MRAGVPLNAPDVVPPARNDVLTPLPSARWRRPVILFACIAVVTWMVLPRLFDANPVSVLRNLQWRWVCAALLAQMGLQVGRGLLLYGVVSDADVRLSRRRAILIVLGASSVGLLGGGYPGFAAAIYRWTRASRVSAASAAMAAWIPSLLLSTAVALIALASACLVLLTNPSVEVVTSRQLATTLGVLATVVACLAVIAARLRDGARRARWIEWLLRGWARVRRHPFDGASVIAVTTQMDTAWRAFQRRSWWTLALLAWLTGCCDALSVWALLHAAHATLSLTSASAAWGVPQLLGNASMLPGGAGVVEVTMTPLLVRFGVAAAPALAVVLAYRALSFWVPMVAGLPLIIWLEREK